MRTKKPTDNCLTCSHAVSPRESYGQCLREHRYISEVLQRGQNCDSTFKGWVKRPVFWIRWMGIR